MAAEIDYLIVGHISQNKFPDGKYLLGGTVFYSSQTVQILGLKAGIVTSINEDADISEFNPMPQTEDMYLNIDYKQVAVGGDDSWSDNSRPHEEFRLSEKRYSYSFILKGISIKPGN